MNKYIALKFFLTGYASIAMGNTQADLCNTGAFTCHQISPNYVVAYPVDKAQQAEQNVVKNNHSTLASPVLNDDTIDVDLTNLTWQVYDENGQIMRSGPVSGGKDYCDDIKDECETVTGTFTIYRKGNEDCKSTQFPVGRGGAPMPYCMFFHGGYAIHGSHSVPNYNASHGCIRMNPQDAKWLNEDYVQEGVTTVHVHY